MFVEMVYKQNVGLYDFIKKKIKIIKHLSKRKKYLNCIQFYSINAWQFIHTYYMKIEGNTVYSFTNHKN